jgi:drug/metabolite transporter (DMT)-like permease
MLRAAMSLSLLAIGVSLLCALAWSGFDLGRKALVGKMDPVPLLVLLTVGQTPLFLGWTLVEGWPPVAAGYWAPALASVALNVVANLAFFWAFKLAPISLTLPLLSLTPAITALLGIPLLGEVPNLRHALGIAAVVAGAFLLNLQKDEKVTVPAMLRAFGRERGAQLMLLVAACWSVAPVLDKIAFQRASVPFHAFVLCGGVALAMLVLLAAQRRLADLAQARRAPLGTLAAILVSTLALGLQFIAYGLTLVAFVETLKRGVGNVLALVWGRSLFGEAVGRIQVAAVALMAVGVALILI